MRSSWVNFAPSYCSQQHGRWQTCGGRGTFTAVLNQRRATGTKTSELSLSPNDSKLSSEHDHCFISDASSNCRKCLCFLVFAREESGIFTCLKTIIRWPYKWIIKAGLACNKHSPGHCPACLSMSFGTHIWRTCQHRLTHLAEKWVLLIKCLVCLAHGNTVFTKMVKNVPEWATEKEEF